MLYWREIPAGGRAYASEIVKHQSKLGHGAEAFEQNDGTTMVVCSHDFKDASPWLGDDERFLRELFADVPTFTEGERRVYVRPNKVLGAALAAGRDEDHGETEVPEPEQVYRLDRYAAAVIREHRLIEEADEDGTLRKIRFPEMDDPVAYAHFWAHVTPVSRHYLTAA